jgi:hypothetical protein
MVWEVVNVNMSVLVAKQSTVKGNDVSSGISESVTIYTDFKIKLKGYFRDIVN